MRPHRQDRPRRRERAPRQLSRFTKQRATCIASALLLLLSAAYVVNGGRDLVFGTTPADAVDLKLRWTEERYFLRGVNPLDVWFSNAERAGQMGYRTRADQPWTAPHPDLGVADPAHPPWAYVTGLMLYWPPWPTARPFFLVCNVVALLVFVAALLHAGRELGLRTTDRWFVAASGLACGAFSTTLGVGQYGIIVLGFLALALRLSASGRDGWAGLAIALALSKPTLAGPFALIPLLHGRWRMTAGMVGYVGLASGVCWIVLGVDPLTMLWQLLGMGEVHATGGDLNATEFMLDLDVSRQTAALGGMLLVLIPASLAIFLLRDQSLWTSFAVAAVAARLWTYHQGYDDLILLFLLATLAFTALSDRPAHPRRVWIAFVLVGFSLWIPARLAHQDWFLAYKLAAWVAGTIVLLDASRQRGVESAAAASART